MFLQKVILTNFRNFKKKEFVFSSPITVFIGPNTIGKTSILEAIYYLATGKSFRAEKDMEAVMWGGSVTRITGIIGGEMAKLPALTCVRRGRLNGYMVKNKSDVEKLELIVADPSSLETPTSRGKKFLVNGVGKRMVDFVGNLKAVLFWPEDLDLVTDSPSLRRRYLDFVLMQIDREYRRSLISYEKGIRQRNKLLERIRDESASRSQLFFWDNLLIKNGNYITEKRQEYIDFINSSGKNLGEYSLYYDLSRISPARLLQYKDEEVAAATTLVGPHRDDFVIKLKTQSAKIKTEAEEFFDRDLSIYGSRGEQRLAILWLKMCEIAFIESKSGERPILLLDDIFSELDHKHRDLVFEIIDKQQTIMTTADSHYIEKKEKEMEIVEL